MKKGKNKSCICSSWGPGSKTIFNFPCKFIGIFLSQGTGLNLTVKDGTKVIAVINDSKQTFWKSPVPIVCSTDISVSYSGTSNYSILYSLSLSQKEKYGVNIRTDNLSYYLKFPDIEFYWDSRTGSTNAQFSGGSLTGIYESARSASAPSTWINSNGVIQASTTSNVPLFDYGYYNATGFHAQNMSYHTWRESTNLLIRTDGTGASNGLWTGWSNSDSGLAGTSVVSVVDNTSVLNIAGTTYQRVQYTGTAGDSAASTTSIFSATNTADGTVSAGNVITLSFWYKGSTSGITSKTFQIVWRDSSNTDLGSSAAVTITDSVDWTKVSLTATAVALTDHVGVRLRFTGIDNGDTIDCSFFGFQLEKHPYATPFIPTTSAALTRAGDALKYENLNNSFADEETIIMQVTPGATFANDSRQRNMYATTTKIRNILKNTTGTQVITSPNATDNSESYVQTSAENYLVNTTYVISTVYKHNSPYIELYVNGVSKGTETVDNFINNQWGQYFYLGSSSTAINQFDGNISQVLKYKRALSSTEIAEISTYMAAN